MTPLIDPISLPYYEEFTCVENECYRRAVDLRLCLDKILDNVVAKLLPQNQSKKFREKKLFEKLDECRKLKILTGKKRLAQTRKLGNRGAHKGKEATYFEKEFEYARKSILYISFDVFAYTLEKFGFIDDENGSFVPYIFSTLPPEYRVEILKKYINRNPWNPLVFEKLANALAKARRKEEIHPTLKHYQKLGYITEQQVESIEKWPETLNVNPKLVPIAQTIEDAKSNFIYATSQILSIKSTATRKVEQLARLMSLIFWGDDEEVFRKVEAHQNRQK